MELFCSMVVGSLRMFSFCQLTARVLNTAKSATVFVDFFIFVFLLNICRIDGIG